MNRMIVIPVATVFIMVAAPVQPDHVNGATSRAGAASSTPSHLGAMLLPGKGYHVTGAVLAIPNGSNSYSVAVWAQGLEEFGMYRIYTVTGSCSANPGTVTQIGSLQPNQRREVTTVSTIPTSKLPSNLGVAISQEGGTGHTGGAFQACGRLFKPDKVVVLERLDHSKAKGVALIKEPGPVNGNHVKVGTDVIVFGQDLARGALEASWIAEGRCGLHGPAAYPLLPLVTDASGRALAGTGVSDAVPSDGMSINVADEMCGNLSSLGPHSSKPS